MSLDKATILISSNKKTKRGVSDIDEELLEVLIDISGRHSWLPGSQIGTLDSDAKATKPDDYACPDVMAMTDSTDLLYDITFTDYINDLMPGYHIRGTEILVTKAYVNSAYTFYYGKLHSGDVETIEFEDRFKAAIVAGVTAEVFRRFQMFAEANAWDIQYETEIQKLIAATPTSMPITEIRSIIRY
jgi:hypothetical protein